MMLILIGILLVSNSVSSSDLLPLDDVQNVPDGIQSQLYLGPPKQNRAEFQVGALTHNIYNLKPKNRYQKKSKKHSSNKKVFDSLELLALKLKSKLEDTFKENNRNIEDRSAPSKHKLHKFSNDLVNNAFQKLIKPPKTSRPEKHLQPSNLLHGNNVDLNKYSKIFIILNPQALNVKPASSRQATMPRIRKKRYFYHTQGTTPQYLEQSDDREVVIYADWRRRMDEGSDEGPKGFRPSRGGTAIPFIGRKGDIYEKDD